jgi:hypothetical protein
MKVKNGRKLVWAETASVRAERTELLRHATVFASTKSVQLERSVLFSNLGLPTVPQSQRDTSTKLGS